MRLITQIRRIATNSRTAVGQQIADDIDKYSQLQPTILSLQSYIDYGKKNTSGSNSGKFALKELPVRFANITRELYLLPSPLLSTSAVQTVQGWYEQSFLDLMKFKDSDLNDEKSLDKFNDTIDFIRTRHSSVVETMAEGILELKVNNETRTEQAGVDKVLVCDNLGVDSRVGYFLDRFYMNRISINTLIGQHLGLYSKKKKVEFEGFIGEIQPKCDVLGVAEDAYENAKFLCEQYYSQSPDCHFICQNSSSMSKDQRIYVAYFPSHLYHMLFELLKNALRAVVEFHKDVHDPPAIEVLICKGDTDISIKISDQGGGIKRSLVKSLFNYMYTTAPRPDSANHNHDGQPPMAGYGYGLPLSKIYARYFGGDLSLYSVDGYGTDAKICLKSKLDDACEVLPNFSKTSHLKLTQNVQIHDWSASTDI